jgi:glycine betaine/proline transport system permease protein
MMLDRITQKLAQSKGGTRSALLPVLARFIRGGRIPRGTAADTAHDAEKALR